MKLFGVLGTGLGYKKYSKPVFFSLPGVIFVIGQEYIFRKESENFIKSIDRGTDVLYTINIA